MKIYYRLDTYYDSEIGDGKKNSPYNFSYLLNDMVSFKNSSNTNFDIMLLGTRSEECDRTIADDFGNLINESNDNRNIKFSSEE